LVEFLLRGGFVEGHGHRFRAAVGRAGVTPHKREGDEATPAGRLTLERVLYRADKLRAPTCRLPIEPIGRDDGWCDDPADAAYNKPVRLPYKARHENLWRNDDLYDVIGVLDWNRAPIIPGRGSAIFLHVASRDDAPTAGCVALALADLLACLAAGMTALEVLKA
jgi:L,D-peptidoglycan transpeptidase YkuD (ErfK/YbiS/YcfS/YnhG family)